MGSADVFSMAMTRYLFFVSTLLKESQSTVRGAWYKHGEIGCVLRWQHTVLCIIVRKKCVVPWKGWIIPLKGFDIPREEWITADTVKSWFLRYLRSPSDVAGLIADSVLHCLTLFQQDARLLNREKPHWYKTGGGVLVLSRNIVLKFLSAWHLSPLHHC